MNKIEDLVKEIAPAKEERPKTYTAEVSHTDDEGIVWVRLPGAEQDTPTASTSSEVKMGDTVTVEWRNNKLYIAGNYTNPSAGVTRVAKAEQTAEKAMSDAETAQAAADSAQETANEAITIAGDTDQHFWFTETGTDTGAHITEATQEDFLADPTNGGGNLLARSNGIAVRDGMSELASFSASGAQIGQTSGRNVTVDTNGLKVKDGSTVAASFGASSATIGKTNSKNVVVDSNGMTVKNGSTTMASITANGATFSTSDLQNAIVLSSEAVEGAQALGTLKLGGLMGPTMQGWKNGNECDFALYVGTGGTDTGISLNCYGGSNGAGTEIIQTTAEILLASYRNGSRKTITLNNSGIDTNAKFTANSLGNIRSGALGSTSVPAGSYVDTAITFSPSMSSTPTVVCSIFSTSTSPDLGSISATAINPSTTGFTIRLFNNSSNQRAPGVSWIAYA